MLVKAVRKGLYGASSGQCACTSTGTNKIFQQSSRFLSPRESIPCVMVARLGSGEPGAVQRRFAAGTCLQSTVLLLCAGVCHMAERPVALHVNDAGRGRRRHSNAGGEMEHGRGSFIPQARPRPRLAVKGTGAAPCVPWKLIL